MLMESSLMRCPASKHALALMTCMAIVLGGGCASHVHVFEQRELEPLWTAMKTVADQPRYDDWTIPNGGNQVWIDEEHRRIEIYRKLQRVTHQPGKIPHVDERTWRIQVYMTKLDPPTAKFVSRDLVVPAWAWEEADRYFTDVEDLLGPLPEPPIDEVVEEIVEVAPVDTPDDEAEGGFGLIEIDPPRR